MALTPVGTVMHFDIRNAPATWSTAYLRVPLHSLDPLPPEGAVDIYAWAGDGVCDPSEHSMGTHIASFSGLAGEFPLITLDITTALEQAIANGDAFYSLRIEGRSPGDRFDVGTFGGVADPYLDLTP